MSKLGVTLNKDKPNSKTERVMIKHKGSVLWLSILSTSPNCIRLRFEEPGSAREFDIVKESLIRAD
jgi:hypothetical protein